jgi:ABC-type transport system substrate-binding protein
VTIQGLRDQINVETDNAKRAQEWQQVQDYLQQNGPWAVAIQPGVYVAMRSNIGSYVWNPAWRVNPMVLTKS